MMEQVETATEFLGKWVRLKSSGEPHRVDQLGRRERDGRQRLYGPTKCPYPEEVDLLDPAGEEDAREEWERNVR